MGFRISWIATQAGKDDVLDALNLHATGAKSEFPDYDFALIDAKAGWIIVQAADVSFFDEQRCVALSRHFPLVAVVVNETTMLSRASRYEAGKQVWSIWHEGHETIQHLESVGALPPVAAEIERQKRAEQAEDDASQPEYSVDIIFEIPLALAEHYCGYKHDEFMGSEEACHELAVRGHEKSKSFFARLLGR